MNTTARKANPISGDKTPAEFAQQMLDLYYGNTEGALVELFNAARQDTLRNPRPNSFYAEAARALLGPCVGKLKPGHMVTISEGGNDHTYAISDSMETLYDVLRANGWEQRGREGWMKGDRPSAIFAIGSGDVARLSALIR